MRITSLNLGIGKDKGLKPTPMSPLGDLVVLAGRNGSGKTRILDTVQELVNRASYYPPQFESIRSSVAGAVLAPRNYNPLAIEEWTQTVRNASLFSYQGDQREGIGLEFFPKSTALVDHRGMNEAEQARAVQEVQFKGIEELNRRALSYVAAIERRAFSATHPQRASKAVENSAAVEDRERFATLCQELLGAKVELDLDGQPTLFGRPIADTRLSEGQRILLQVAVALHSRGAGLGGLILFLDEPECHLHPAVVVQAIQKLRAANADGQIWIATHCVPVLAAMPVESIWYVNDGGASWAGRRPEIVLEGLLGGPENRGRMEEFLRLPAQFASNQFAAECLVPPGVVSTGADDPQAQLLRQFCVEATTESGSHLKVVDFGAGQGRLLSAMNERWESETAFADTVDYRAFEPFPDNTDALMKVVSSVYPSDSPSRVILRHDDLAKIDDQTVDLVVMCNVLHEIPPEEWTSLFGTDGCVTRILKKSGHLLVLEDMEMPHGEKAHRFGFVLLDEPHLYQLMACVEDDERIRSVTARDGRLRAHAIPGSLLGRTTRKTTLEALKGLLVTARREVKNVREAAVESRSGRLHALWTQQLANADLGITALE